MAGVEIINCLPSSCNVIINQFADDVFKLAYCRNHGLCWLEKISTPASREGDSQFVHKSYQTAGHLTCTPISAITRNFYSFGITMPLEQELACMMADQNSGLSKDKDFLEESHTCLIIMTDLPTREYII